VVGPTKGKIILQRQIAHADTLWARTWWESHHFHLPLQRV